MKLMNYFNNFSDSGLVAAFRLLSIFGIKTTRAKDLSMNATSVKYFPLVGLFLGSISGLIMYFISKVGDSFLGAIFAISALFVLTGFLHLDGLIDTFDAILLPAPKSRRLEVIKDPRIGAFGFGGASLVMLALVGSLSRQKTSIDIVGMLGAICCISRVFSVLAMVLYPSAKKEGMAYFFSSAAKNSKTLAVIILFFFIGVVLLTFSSPYELATRDVIAAGISSLASLILSAAFNSICSRSLGGITGDTLGATIVLSELFLIFFMSLNYFS